ncbi:putative Multi-sensor hybrid histidine kinase [Nitrospina gracilis 3/211]|uniref:histidine kinase n=1 Tax=Nitrospina gracilis (strain 3/211) TaxID=1266370 RepID=M1YW23_NITG3|nr:MULTISPECIES: MHYT domain-containing protein [Nitrospina]MCF8722706.1 polar amino acid transport system substrate-binding protein [Nitrospina sp. Nb-3]CCQ89649.1 putative Multi-sensor hybrid histidine kinase [Nitrospina gracilis 3/211]
MIFPAITQEIPPLQGTFSYGLVALSYLIAVFASYTALDVMNRIKKEELSFKNFLIVSVAVCMGGGIWSMHFIGMLAYTLPIPVSYDPWITILSLVAAIVASGIGFYLAVKLERMVQKVVLGGLVMGAGICVMHYSGMHAMTLEASQHYRLGLLLLSILIAVTASMAALYIILKFREGGSFSGFAFKLVSAMVMGLAVAGMHYTGMAASVFVPSPELIHDLEVVIDKDNLALSVVLMTFFILTMALFLEEYSSITVLPVMFCFFMIVIGWGGFQLVDREIKSNIANLLNTNLKTNVASVRALVQREMQVAKFWSRDPRIQKNIQSLAEKVSNGMTTKNELMASRELSDLRRILGPFHKNQDHVGFVVVHPSGLTMAALLDEPVGRSLLKDKEFVKEAMRGEVVFSSPFWGEVQLPDLDGVDRDNQPTIFTASPVFNENGEVIAVLGFRLRPIKAFGKSLEVSFFGESGEAYAFNSQGYMIGGSRFLGHLKRIGMSQHLPSQTTMKVQIRNPGGNILQGHRPTLPRDQQPFTRMIQSALKGESGLDVDGYRDYRGVPVVGAWTWLPEYNVGIATEMDFDEAYRSSRTLERIFVALLFVLFFAVVVTLVLKRRQAETEKRRAELQDNEIRARDEAEKFRKLFLAEADTILICDAETRQIRDANPAAEKLYGYTRDELLALRVDDLSADPEGTAATFRELREGRLSAVALRYHKKKDGTQFPIEVMEGHISTQEGPVVFKVIRDISRRMKAEEDLRKSEERFSLVLDATQDGIWDDDRRTGTCYFSPQWMAMLGYEPDELPHTNATFFDRIHPEDRECYGELIQAHLEQSNENFEFEVRLVHKDGSYRWVLTRGKTVERDEEGNVVRAVGTHTNIHARKAIEEELMQAQTEAISANEAKSRFLANMSHEIRTPMNAILGLAHLALQNEMPPKQKGYLEKIEKSGQNLLGIINDILDFSKVEAGKLDLEMIPFEIRETLEHISQQQTYFAEECETELVFFCSPMVPGRVIGDPLRVAQVLTNLVSNALKFTSKGTVAVYTDLVESPNAKQNRVELKFVVQDTGIGMAEDQIQGVFGAFTQADASTTRKYGGTGLGLAITRQLVGLMRGRIHVESEPGEGTTFTVALPFECEQEELERATRQSHKIKNRALVIESNPVFGKMLEGMLRSVSFDTDYASTLERGERILTQAESANPYHFVLLDLGLVQSNWSEVCARLKASNPQSEQMKLVLVAPQLEYLQLVTVEGEAIDGVLVKPVRLSQLFDMVTSLFYNKDSQMMRSAACKPESAFDPTTFHGCRVLVAEDNEINQEVVEELLQKVGFDVTIVDNGKAAVDRLSSEEFDMVLMDLQMPVMDGLEAARQIRQDKKFESLPVIALTANAMTGDRERTAEAGMNDHVTKPIDPESMYKTLSRWIKSPARAESEKPAEPPPMEEKTAKPPMERMRQDAVETSDNGFPVIPGLNVEIGLKRMGGNPERYRKTLVDFYEKHAGDGEKIRSAFENKDTLGLRMAVHDLKGVAGNMGADTLFDQAEMLEQALKAGDRKDHENQLRGFLNSLEEVMDPLGKWSGVDKPVREPLIPLSSRNSMCNEQAGILLHNLQSLLEESDSRATVRVAALRGYLEGSPLHDDWKRLNKYIEVYQFDEALQVLQKITWQRKRQCQTSGVTSQ